MRCSTCRLVKSAILRIIHVKLFAFVLIVVSVCVLLADTKSNKSDFNLQLKLVCVLQLRSFCFHVFCTFMASWISITYYYYHMYASHTQTPTQHKHIRLTFELLCFAEELCTHIVISLAVSSRIQACERVSEHSNVRNDEIDLDNCQGNYRV